MLSFGQIFGDTVSVEKIEGMVVHTLRVPPFYAVQMLNWYKYRAMSRHLWEHKEQKLSNGSKFLGVPSQNCGSFK